MSLDTEKQALSIIRKLSNQGFESWLVGGAARDMILCKPPDDYDIVTSASPEDIRRIFRNRMVKIVGRLFSVCLVDGIEVATFRKDRSLTATFSSSLREDLAKRDLTFNALAFNPLTGEHIDLFGGIRDLKDGVIRFTGNARDRILEDPLRMVRACRFKATFDGEFHEKTVEAIREYRALLQTDVAGERLRLEILKVMGLKRPGIFFKALLGTGLIEYIFPSLSACVDCDGGPFHGETVWDHLLMTGDAISPRYPLLRLAGYLHDAGKPAAASERNGKRSFVGHEGKSVELIRDELKKLKFSNAEIDYIANLVGQHMRDITTDSSRKAVRKFIKRLLDHQVDIRDWLRLKIADRKANLKRDNYALTEIKSILRNISDEMHPSHEKGVFQTGDLNVSGNDVMEILGLPQGRKVGQILEALLKKVLDDPSLNTREKLVQMIKKGLNG
ncbi:MAG: CCA tRNA nucleotidyltransferase [Proteobacteria bacterium]|nr:CCA tRNA nucleotidyltransferase [Pseudomonadota bacterium]